MKRTILITGATSGFGEATAKLFAEHGNNLIITGRREERLQDLKSELENDNVSVKTLCFDIQKRDAVAEAIASLDDAWRNIDVLINNAGLASGLNTIQEGDIDDWEKMIDTNVKGLLYLSRAIMPLMIERKTGHIINVGSTAGKQVYANGNVYAATKHAVDAISQAMRIDLLKHGIKVTQIRPGAAETEFSIVRFHGDQVKAKSVYNGYQPMVAKDIAEVIYYSSTLPAHLCINDLEITSVAQASSYYINRQ
ncbi:MAG: 3-hydroxy acid dehydrogenase/malonic semialdehyde reductase [Patiriisocius sp.]|jgi:3-hydroxy acid dehydrogenase/malonic semialdehyde reductase